MDLIQNDIPKAETKKSEPIRDRKVGEKERGLSFKERMQAQEEEVPSLEGLMAPPPYVHQVSSFAPATSGVIPEILELSTKLVGPLTESAKKGIGRTRIILDLKGLSLIEVVIDHYDTDPLTFHIKLMGDEKAQRLFQQNKGALQTQLKSTVPTFHCSISAPTFRPRSFLKRGEEKNSLVKSRGVGYCDEKEALLSDG